MNKGHNLITQAFLWIFLVFGSHCLAQTTNQFGLKDWTARNLETGESLDLRSLPYRTLAVNVYAPNCPPCVKEIPTLNRIYNRLTDQSDIGIIMVVDPQLVVDSVDKSVWVRGESESIRDLAVRIMKNEKAKFKIELPIYLMNENFRVGAGQFVTATPETLLIRTEPWNIYYNFIGSISEKQSLPEIDSDSRVNFFLNSVGARVK